MQEMPAEQARTGQAASLRDRLRFAGMDSADGETLRRHRQTLERHVETVRAVINNCLRVMPTHEEFIARHCAAPPMAA